MRIININITYFWHFNFQSDFIYIIEFDFQTPLCDSVRPYGE